MVFLVSCAGQQPQVIEPDVPTVYADRDGDGIVEPCGSCQLEATECSGPPDVPTPAAAIEIVANSIDSISPTLRKKRQVWSVMLNATFWAVYNGTLEFGMEIEGCSGKVTGYRFVAR